MGPGLTVLNAVTSGLRRIISNRRCLATWSIASRPPRSGSLRRLAPPRRRRPTRKIDRQESETAYCCSPPTGSKTFCTRWKRIQANGLRPSLQRFARKVPSPAGFTAPDDPRRSTHQFCRGNESRICARQPRRALVQTRRGPGRADRQDKSSDWDPQDFEEVTDEMLDVLFAPLPETGSDAICGDHQMSEFETILVEQRGAVTLWLPLTGLRR